MDSKNTGKNRRAPAQTTCVLPADQLKRAIRRLAHEILENIDGGGRVPFVLMGLQRGGVWIADALRDEVRAIDNAALVDCGAIDVSMYRDDLAIRPTIPASASIVPRSLEDRKSTRLNSSHVSESRMPSSA